MITIQGRTAEYKIDPVFLERWSPRAFAGTPISQAELMSMLEAARWAPSASNVQPWRFVYVRRDTPRWAEAVDLLSPNNQTWARDAAALVFLFSETVRRAPDGTEKPSSTHALDAGTASGFFLLQAQKMGWFVHGMAGFDRARAASTFAAPPEFRAEAVYAVGRLGDPAKLPEALQKREIPSQRRPLAETAFEDGFGGATA